MSKAQRKWVLASVGVTILAAGGLISSKSPAALRGQPADAEPFEGAITITVDSASQEAPRATTYEVKGSRARTTITGTTADAPSGYLLSDSDARKSWLVIDEKQIIAELDHARVNDEAAALFPTTPAADVKRTGVYEKVAGLSCELWEVTAGDAHISACVAVGLRVASPAATGGSPFVAQGGFPLRAIYRDGTGTVTRHEQVTRLERRPIDAERFELPNGYLTVDGLALNKAVEDQRSEAELQ